ncbi:hypothetical protein [Marinoscillum sp. MHG1-6]|uniref:hypothetical protein n=1 Tax=Marinoscillum sp. MHG1-6 TaxID=2959627 RepID=UPI0021581689|nr:hypothetical protein [Marinoscillum sp. MHG1-6]
MNTLHYDLLNTYFVSDFYISESRELLTTQQKEELDSTLIFDPNCYLSWKTALIRQLPTDDRYYQAVRTAAEKGDGTALTTLAKFQRQEDKELILSGYSIDENNYMILRAIREFPDPEFYPYLTKKFRGKWSNRRYSFSEWRILYQALAQYPDEPETIELFKKTLKARGNFKRQTFCSYMKAAILKYPNPQFEPIMAKIKLDEVYERKVSEIVDDYR